MRSNDRPVRMLALGFALMAACSSPFAETPEAGEPPGPSKELAARPERDGIASGGERTGEESDRAEGDKRGTAGGRNPRSSDSGGKGEDSGGPVATFEIVGRIGDPRGDASSDTPGYGDVVSVSIASDGARARVVVTMAGELPTRLTGGEIEGVGVNLNRGSDEYQVFASGEPGGWYGYLYTPDGFVEYEGSFAVAGKNLVFVVPWSALGGTGEGTFSAFVDWTGRSEGGTNPFSQDLAPDDGTGSFRAP